MKTVALTGSTGMIGTALTELCVQQNIEVYAFYREGSAHAARLADHPLVHKVACPLEELASLNADTLKQCDAFFHLGWAATIGGGRNDMSLQLENVRHTLDAAALAHRLGCGVFVGAGSQAEYGRVEGVLNGSVPAFPENGYGIAKLCAGQMSRIVCQKYGMRHVWARILSVYGPCDNENTMVSSLIRALLSGEKPSLTAGEQQWDYLYCEDAARALLALGERGADGKVYCVGSGETKRLSEYMEKIRDAVSPGAPLGIGDVPYGERQVMYLAADISDLKDDTGWEPQIPFEEGIARTITWYKGADLWKKRED